MSDSIQKQLKEMAQLSLLSNRLSETQMKNLKYFPFVFFEQVSEVKLDYDLGHGVDEEKKEVHHKSSVSYYLTLNEKANDNLNRRFEAIEVSVRHLFWKDVKVKVYFNNRLAYESKNV